MNDAGRNALSWAQAGSIGEPVEELASAYLDAAEGDAARALRLAVADRVAEQERATALRALVSRGFARWGRPHG